MPLPPDAVRIKKESKLPPDAVRVSPPRSMGVRSGEIAGNIASGIVKGFKPDNTPSPYGMFAPHMKAAENVYGALKDPAMQMLKPITDRAPANESMNQFFEKRIGFSPLSVVGKLKTPVGSIAGEVGKVSQRSVAELLASIGIDVGTGAATDLGASRVLPAIGKNILRPLARTAEGLGGRFINNLIKPRAAGYRFGANPGRAVAKHIGPKMSQESLLDDVVKTRERLIGDLESMASDSTSVVNATPIFEEIQSAYSKLRQMPETFSSQRSAHSELARDIKNLIIENGGFIRGNQIFIDPKNAIKVKRLIGELPSWNTLDPKLGSITKTARKMYGRFDKEIDKAIPGAKEINQDVSDLIGAEQGIKLGAQREQNKDPLKSLSDMIFTGIGAAHGGAPGAAIGYGASRILRSTPFNTVAGAVGGRLAKAGKASAEILESTRGPGLIETAIRKLLSPEKARVIPDFGPEGLPPGGPTPRRLPPGGPSPKRLTKPQGFERVGGVYDTAESEAAAMRDFLRSRPRALPKGQGFEMMTPEQADEALRIRGLSEFEGGASSGSPNQIITPESIGSVRKSVTPKERFGDSELMKSVRELLKRFEKRSRGRG